MTMKQMGAPQEKPLNKKERELIMGKAYPVNASNNLPDYLKPKVAQAISNFLIASNNPDKLASYNQKIAALDSLSSTRDQKVLFQVLASIKDNNLEPNQNAQILSIPPNQLIPKANNQNVQLLDSQSYVDPENMSTFFKTTNESLESLERLKVYDLKLIPSDLEPKFVKTITDIVNIHGSLVPELKKITLIDNILNKLTLREAAQLQNFIDGKDLPYKARIIPN
jgi:hypothetical protein